jgi:hypothetical protein
VLSPAKDKRTTINFKNVNKGVLITFSSIHQG